jgi:hypothetical protein
MIRIQPKNSYLPNLLEIRIPNLLVTTGEETKREEQRDLGQELKWKKNDHGTEGYGLVK